MVPPNWWSEEYGFFGSFYLCGDDSIEGHLSIRHSQAERTREEVEGICRLSHLRPGDKVLDVPCGAGRHSLALAEMGYPVLGIDLNGTHLAEARRQAVARKLLVSFEQADMLAFCRPQAFDLAINMFYSFGFFESEEENKRVLRNFQTSLKPGGRFLMHTDVNLDRIRSGTYRLNEVRHLAGGGVLRIDERFDSASRRIVGSWSIENGTREESRTYSVRVYEVEEIGRASCRERVYSSV